MKLCVGVSNGVKKDNGHPYQWVYWTEEDPRVDGLKAGNVFIDRASARGPAVELGDKFEVYAKPGTRYIDLVCVEGK